MKPAEILIVDDDKDIARIISRTLDMEGFRTITAASSGAALNQLARHAPELIILDIMLPDRPGTEILPRITADYPDTAVIMATANTETETAVNCLKAGAYDYLTKPFHTRQVITKVNRILAERRRNLERKQQYLNLEKKVKEQSSKIKSGFFNAITSLTHALEAKDRYTRGHSQKVAEIAYGIAREMGLAHDLTVKIRLAGLIHDIGKIGIRENILNKPGKLTEAEYNHIKNHPEIGKTILTPIISDRDTLGMVRHHHENYDGSGYPSRLRGAQIPLGARILKVADTYDAMTSERPYRNTMSREAACADMEGQCQGCLDPSVFQAFKAAHKRH